MSELSVSCRIWINSTLAALLFTGIALPAQAQMTPQPWGFSQQNRASIAALMQQAEHPSAYGSGGGDTLICGGGTGQSSATANSTCIILSQATGDIQLGQDSNGDQGASSASPAAQPQNQPPSGADAVLSTLSNH